MKYFGKYRGKVEGNLDPMQLGRVQVSVPTVLGKGRMSWANPCAPFAGNQVGFFAIPPEGANVWVEFEEGDANRPIWSGGFWGVGEVPAMPALAEMKVIKTSTCTITLSDLPGIGGVTIETTAGMKLQISALGIELSNGAASIKLTGPLTSINQGALDVQ